MQLNQKIFSRMILFTKLYRCYFALTNMTMILLLLTFLLLGPYPSTEIEVLVVLLLALVFVIVFIPVYAALPTQTTSEADLNLLIDKIDSPAGLFFAKNIFGNERLWYWHNALTSWMHISFEGLMPLFYLFLGYSLIKIDSENKKMKEELEQVV